MSKTVEEMSVDELKAELQRLKENLEDFEEMHSFTFGKTSVHIGASKAQNLQEEYEEEVKAYNELIAKLEELLKRKGAG